MGANLDGVQIGSDLRRRSAPSGRLCHPHLMTQSLVGGGRRRLTALASAATRCPAPGALMVPLGVGDLDADRGGSPIGMASAGICATDETGRDQRLDDPAPDTVPPEFGAAASRSVAASSAREVARPNRSPLGRPERMRMPPPCTRVVTSAAECLLRRRNAPGTPLACRSSSIDVCATDR